MKKVHISAIILIAVLAVVLIATNKGIFKGGITGYSAFSGNPPGGMNLSISDETDSSAKHVSEQIKFFANLTNSTDGSIINDTMANVSINIPNLSINSLMSFNSTSQLWEFNASFGSIGEFYYNITGNSSLFSPDFVTADDIALVSPDNNRVCLNTTICEYSNINDAIDNEGSAGVIYLMQENYTHLLEENATIGLIAINATGTSIDCNGSIINDSDGSGSEVLSASYMQNISVKNCTIYGEVNINHTTTVLLENDSLSTARIHNSTRITLKNNFHLASEDLLTNSTSISIINQRCQDITDFLECIFLSDVTDVNITNISSNNTGNRNYVLRLENTVRNLRVDGGNFYRVGDIVFAGGAGVSVFNSDFRNIMSENARYSIFFAGAYYNSSFQNITINQTGGIGPFPSDSPAVSFYNSSLRNLVMRSTFAIPVSYIDLSGTSITNMTADSRIHFTGAGPLSTIRNISINNSNSQNCMSVEGKNISIENSAFICSRNISFSLITGAVAFKNSTIDCSDSSCISADSGQKLVIANNTFSNAGNSTDRYLLDGMRSFLAMSPFDDAMAILKGTSVILISNSTPINFSIINGTKNMSVALVKVAGLSINATVYFESGFLGNCSTTDICDFLTAYGGVGTCFCSYDEPDVFIANGYKTTYTPNFIELTTKIPGAANESLRYDVTQLTLPFDIWAGNSTIEGNTFKSSRVQERTIILNSNNSKLFNNNFLAPIFSPPVEDNGANNSFCVNGVGNFYEESLTPMPGDCGPISGNVPDQTVTISFSWNKQDSSKTVYYDVFINKTAAGVPVKIADGITSNSISYSASGYIGSSVKLIIIPWINGSRFNGTHFITNSFMVNDVLRTTAGGGGGGGAPIIMKVADATVTDEPQEVRLIEGTQLRFSLDLKDYTLKVSDVSTDSAQVFIAGSIMEFGLNEPRQIDLNNDDKPDIIITLKNAVVNRVINGERITEAYFELVKYISPEAKPKVEVIEAKPAPAPIVEAPAPIVEAPAPEAAKKNYLWVIVLVIAAVIIIIALSKVLAKKKRKHKHK